MKRAALESGGVRERLETFMFVSKAEPARLGIVARCLALSVLCLWLMAAPARAVPSSLETVLGSYNLFLSGDLGTASSNYGGGSQGAVAVGGKAWLSGVAINANGGSTVPALTVGGNLKFSNGYINGDVYAGGSAKVTSAGVNGTVFDHQKTLPVDIDAMMSDISTTSAYLASTDALAMGTVGMVAVNPGNALTLTGTSSGVNFFSVTAAQLAAIGSGSLVISAPTGSTAIVNVSGTSVNVGGGGGYGINFNGIAMNNVLFNFYQATSITMHTFDGAVVAPQAAVTLNNGSLQGTLIAASLAGAEQLNSVMYQGSVQVFTPDPNPGGELPEPSTGAGLLLALWVGWTMRRRQTTS
jgi:choice-of-anchor A domain-containing protein